MSRFWGLALAGVSLVPLSAWWLNGMSGWLCLPSVAVFVACGVVLMRSRWAHRADDVLLLTALLLVLLHVFWQLGGGADVALAGSLLTLTGAVLHAVGPARTGPALLAAECPERTTPVP